MSDRQHSIRQSFIAGLLALLPLYVTGKVLSFLFAMVDGPAGTRIDLLVSRFVGQPVHIPGLGLLTTLLLVLAIGWLTRMVFFRQLLQRTERAIERVPLVRSVYTASRQIASLFSDEHKTPFSQVVLVEYPMAGRHTIGLVAHLPPGDDPLAEVVVFFPSNHLHLGYPVLLPRKDMLLLDLTVEEAIKFFLSCGVVGGDDLIHRTAKARASSPDGVDRPD